MAERECKYRMRFNPQYNEWRISVRLRGIVFRSWYFLGCGTWDEGLEIIHTHAKNERAEVIYFDQYGVRL